MQICWVNKVQFGAVITQSIFSQKTPHSSPVRAGYGVSFVDTTSDLYSALVPVIISEISILDRIITALDCIKVSDVSFAAW